MASYSYSLSGKIYYSSTGLPVSGAVVKLTINFSGGGEASGSVFSAQDGSYSFNVTSGALDYKNATMNLKATTTFCAGSTNWTCLSYSETKDVKISCNMVINPNLSVRLNSATFATAGIQLPSTTVAYLDNSAPPMEITSFQTTISYDSTKMYCASVGSTPGSPFMIDSVMPGLGTITVHGYSFAPIPIVPVIPTSFFDVYFEVFASQDPSFTDITVQESTMLYPVMGPPQHPYPHVTENLIGEPEKCKATFLISGYGGWEKALDAQRPYSNIKPMSMANWEQYMNYWHDPLSEKEGQLYPETTFVPCDEENGSGMLYAWPGGGGDPCYPEGPGLVMAWKYNEQQEGNYASAWRYDYGLDPDLRNCTIQVTVSPMLPHINAVSFSIVDIAGKMRTWWWSVPAAIPLGVATTVKINTAIAGIGAATPAATGYMNVPGFNLAQSQFFDVDENFQYIFGQLPVPPPGQQQPLWGWNYWHNLTVTKNTSAHKWFYIKYSQKPDVIEDSQPPMINGWDELSLYANGPIMADDWECTDDRPITDVHWWGSFIGWTQPYLPPVLPKGFHIGIWTDVAQNDPHNQFPYSHPGKLIWENTCTSWVWNFAGYDQDPRPQPMEDEACFQFTQLLSEDQWFQQDPNDNVYWLSIAAIYDPTVQVQYPWGWKTRPHQFNDDAIRIHNASIWPPTIGAIFNVGIPVELGGESWDLAFELSTNEPQPPASADLNYDGFVDLADFAIFAQQWLTAG
jgi:hypothetical protein